MTTEPQFTNGVGREMLGTSPHLYRPDMWRPADEIGISRFRQIFTWPLALRLDRAAPGRKAQREALGRCIDSLTAHNDWSQVTDRLDQDTPFGVGADNEAEAAHTYSEFVYFHDFMQDTLFGEGREPADSGQPVSIFSNSRIRTLDVIVRDAASKDWRGHARVERMQLHLYRTGALILAVEVDFEPQMKLMKQTKTGDGTGTENAWVIEEDGTRPMQLSDILLISDRLRRVYSPFFSPDKDLWRPGLVPLCVAWSDEKHRVVADSGPLDVVRPGEALAGLRKADRTGRRNPPVYRHWSALLAPLRIAGDAEAEADEPLWRHVVDERVPTMSFVSLSMEPDEGSVRDTLRRVSRGDWIRLCYAEAPGAQPLPYAAHFLKEFEQDTCYDRFMACDSAPDNYGTRYMFAGYHFVEVGAGRFFEEVLQHHFRRHYFQMAKAMHMEVASLLAASSRVTDAVCALRDPEPDEGARDRFHEELLDIQHDFMDFVHLFRFTGVSNQLQPTEMFRMWRRSLDLDRLFEDVSQELRSATDFVFAEDERRQTDNASRLNMIAALGVVLGIGLAFLGANVNFDPAAWDPTTPHGGLDWWRGARGNLAALGFSIAGPSIAALFLLHKLTRYRGRLFRWLICIMWFLLVLGAVLMLVDFLPVWTGQPGSQAGG